MLAWKPMSAHSSTIALGDLNAKLFHRTPADEDIIGQYFFESQLRKEMAQTNRELLLEVCRAMRCCVANTFFEHTPENLVTFRTLGTTPQAAITTATFSQIDHCLVPHAMLDNVADIWADRGASLQTQHYILQVFMRLSFARSERRASERGCDVRRLLSDLSLRNGFGALFCEQMESATAAENLDQQATNVEDAMRVASSVAVRTGRVARRPWISQRTLDLIEQREESREQGWAQRENQQHRQVRASAKQDKRDWIEEELVGGPWSAVKALRKGKAKKPVQVRDAKGALIASDQRGNTMADYFEHVQWQVSFADFAPTGTAELGATLPVNVQRFTMEELRVAVKGLAAGKAPGSDKIPPEFWKVLIGSANAMDELLGLCRTCWANKAIPSQWRLATVVLLYKKGDASLP